MSDVPPMKIFPRNLTARAATVVRGNPASTRPESGVDNCYPGLEFDQRNLDKVFFGGLVFEFQRPDGAIVTDLLPGSGPAEAGLLETDLPLFLWWVLGPAPADGASTDISVSLRDLGGLEAWRHVHDLGPGRIVVLVGPGSSASAPPFDPGLDQQLHDFRESGRSVVQRGDDGRMQIAALVGDRARYLDDDGVIDPEVYDAGELTRSLCAPWQYDFRDCGCFYWAATKPDVVTSSDGRVPFLNFQRRDRTTSPPEPDLATNSQERREKEFDYGELVAGAWNELAVVIDDRENVPAVHPVLPPVELMSRQQVVDELVYLATVEHALCVEYLYAHYSLDAPPALPASGVSSQAARVFAAARDVFGIAVDEMRHLRWVNEVLDLLGEPPSIGRAERIGRQLDRPFTLEPLTPDRLQWFVDVERPSQDLTGALDGMYVRLHTSILGQPDVFPEQERLVHLVKLIIDEGEDHFERFSSMQGHLAGLAPDDYLRPLGDGSDPRLSALQDLSDQNYAALLGALQTTFSLGDRAGGILLEQARRAMFNLHETNHYLAAQGVRSRFTLPTLPPRGRLDAAGVHELVESLAGGVQRAAGAVADAGAGPEHELAVRAAQRNQELFDLMHRLVDEDFA